MNNMGGITEIATAFPGNTGSRPNNVAPLAEMLRLNGYSTGFFGKNHETAAWEVSPSGPTDRWPTRSGFDKFYGFIGGETNQWAPTALRWLDAGGVAERSQLPLHDRHDQPGDSLDAATRSALTPDKPFFMYFAPAPRTRRTMCRRNGLRSTRASSMEGWDQAARRDPGRGRSSWASCLRARSSPKAGSHQGLGQALG